jgi:hypothetical protein
MTAQAQPKLSAKDRHEALVARLRAEIEAEKKVGNG